MVSTRSRSSVNVSADDHERPAKRARLAQETEHIAAEPASSKGTPQANDASSRPKGTRARKGKGRAADEPVPDPRPADFPARVQTAYKIGAHVFAAGGVQHAIVNAAKLGAGAFALFLKSQRKWTGPELTLESIGTFKRWMAALGYESKHVLPHGSYLVNMGNPDAAKREKSYVCFVDELRRCEQLGLTLYNFHPGSSVGECTVDEAIASIAECVNRAHKETSSVTVVLENMAGAGNIVGGKFEHLAEIIAKVEDQTRVGVCLDTCHMYAAGYDIRSKVGWNSTMDEFDRIVGAKYLRGMHLNDSMTPLGSKKDRHENIGLGTLSLQAFGHILSDPRTRDIPLILETPPRGGEGMWRAEVRALHLIATAGAEMDGALEEGEVMIRAAAKACGWTKTVVKAKAKKGKQKSADEDEEDDGGCC